MKNKPSQAFRIVVLITLTLTLTVLSSKMHADTGSCGGGTTTLPFTDVPATGFFCQIAAAYFSGLTSGTTATTYSPTQPVTREQMAAFITRTMDQSLKRGSNRAISKKWWTPQAANNLTLTSVGAVPRLVEFDGTDLWVPNNGSSNVMRIRPSDGKIVETWSAAADAFGILAAAGRVFITGQSDPGNLFMIDPTQTPGNVTLLTGGLGAFPTGIAFDGLRFWTANFGGSVSIVALDTTVTTITTGFDSPFGILYDGANIWVTDRSANTLLKLDSNGSVLQTINVGGFPRFPVFDGTNIWVPNSSSDSMTVVRVKDAAGNPLTTAFVLATLTGNGLSGPITAAFDGERILVANSGDSISLWKAADLTPIGSFSSGTSTNPYGACSDGLSFWITLNTTEKLARF